MSVCVCLCAKRRSSKHSDYLFWRHHTAHIHHLSHLHFIFRSSSIHLPLIFISSSSHLPLHLQLDPKVPLETYCVLTMVASPGSPSPLDCPMLSEGLPLCFTPYPLCRLQVWPAAHAHSVSLPSPTSSVYLLHYVLTPLPVYRFCSSLTHSLTKWMQECMTSWLNDQLANKLPYWPFLPPLYNTPPLCCALQRSTSPPALEPSCTQRTAVRTHIQL